MLGLAGPPGGSCRDRPAEVQHGSGSSAAEDGAQGARGLQEDGQVEHSLNKTRTRTGRTGRQGKESEGTFKPMTFLVDR